MVMKSTIASVVYVAVAVSLRSITSLSIKECWVLTLGRKGLMD